MAYREVGLFEVKEVLRLWIGGAAKKQIARQVGLDPKTVRRYVEVALANGLEVGPGPSGSGRRSPSQQSRWPSCTPV